MADSRLKVIWDFIFGYFWYHWAVHNQIVTIIVTNAFSSQYPPRFPPHSPPITPFPNHHPMSRPSPLFPSFPTPPFSHHPPPPPREESPKLAGLPQTSVGRYCGCPKWIHESRFVDESEICVPGWNGMKRNLVGK